MWDGKGVFSEVMITEKSVYKNLHIPLYFAHDNFCMEANHALR